MCLALLTTDLVMPDSSAARVAGAFCLPQDVLAKG